MLWCFGALYSTRIVAPRTPNSYGAIRDKLRMSSLAANTFEPELDSFLQFEVEVGHVTPGYPGMTYPLAFRAVCTPVF